MARAEIYRHYIGEIRKLIEEVNYIKTNEEYFYTEKFTNISSRYNNVLKKYHKSTGIPLEQFKIFDYELSKSKKSVRDSGIERLIISLSSTNELVNNEYELNKGNKIDKPIHQIRKCLKTGEEGCPKNPELYNNKVFVGMSFDDKYFDSFEYGIKLAVEHSGYECYRADDNMSNIDIMCKICKAMQESKYLIFNISGYNPNVMLELGLSYGLGKETIIVKDKETKIVTDIGNVEYIEYSHAGDLRDKITRYFQEK